MSHLYRLWFSLSDRDKCYSDRYYNLWCVVKPSESHREQVKLNELLSILQFSDKDTDWTYWPLSDSCGSRKFAIFCNTLDQDNRLSLCIFWLVHFCFHAICELTHLLANNGYFSSDHLVTQSVACLICGILWALGAGAAKQTHRDMLVPLCRLYGYVWNRCTAELYWRKKYCPLKAEKRNQILSKLLALKMENQYWLVLESSMR